MNYAWLTATLLAAATFGSCQSTEQGSAPKEEHQHGGTTADQPSVHGMLALGDGPVYLSHLPMFQGPHDYQVILEVELQKEGSDPTAIYAQDRRITGEKVYTLVPEVMVLPELLGSVNGLPQRTTFKGKLFRGHFERGGTQLLTGLTIRVKRVVFAKKFDRNAAALPHAKYLVFGNETELFAAHIVQKKPDFDHLAALRVAGGIMTEEQAKALRQGLTVSFETTANTPDAALVEGQSVEGSVDFGQGGQIVGLDVLTSYYLETGDLSF